MIFFEITRVPCFSCNQDRSIVQITEISESQKDAIHALETLVQIGQHQPDISGHLGQHQPDISGQLDQAQADHVMIQFETRQETQQEMPQVCPHSN